MLDVPLGPRLNWENDTEMYIREYVTKLWFELILLSIGFIVWIF